MATTTSDMLSRSASPDVLHLVTETCWVAFGFVLYFLVQVYFVPKAKQLFLGRDDARAMQKTHDLEEDIEGAEEATDPASKSFAAAKELAAEQQQHADRPPATWQRPSPAVVPLSPPAPKPAAPEPQQGWSAILSCECPPPTPCASCECPSPTPRRPSFLELRRQQRLGYVRGFHPYQDLAARAKAAEAPRLQAIPAAPTGTSAQTSPAAPPSFEVPQLPPLKHIRCGNDEHYLLQLWREAMAIPCPPLSPTSAASAMINVPI